MPEPFRTVRIEDKEDLMSKPTPSHDERNLFLVALGVIVILEIILVTLT